MSLHFISSIQHTLSQLIPLLEAIPKADYKDMTQAPYYSSIGKHTRHILDFYSCIFKGLNTYLIDLTARDRDTLIETNSLKALERVKKIIEELETYKMYDLAEKYELVDDFGTGKQSIPTNLYSVFAQANLHSIHHYAIIAQLLALLQVPIQLDYFGYNPTTPNKIQVQPNH